MTMFCDCGNPEAHRGEHIPKPVTDTPLDPYASAPSAPSPDDPHGACSRALVGMAVERDKAQSASAASERAYRETRAIADDNLRRLLDCREVVRSLTAERDASRTAHAALVADLRALVGGDELVSQRAVNPDEYTRRTGDRVPSYLAFYQGAADLAAVIRALLDRHALTTGDVA